MVALPLVAEYAVRIAVVQRRADVEVVGVERHAHLGPLGRLLPLHGLLLQEAVRYLRARPRRLVEAAVERHPLGRTPGARPARQARRARAWRA